MLCELFRARRIAIMHSGKREYPFHAQNFMLTYSLTLVVNWFFNVKGIFLVNWFSVMM